MLDELLAAMRRYDRVDMAYKSGVSIHTINRLMSGADSNPTIKTVEALRKYCDEQERVK